MISISEWLYYNVFLALLPLLLEVLILSAFAKKFSFLNILYKTIENGSLFIFSMILSLSSISTHVLKSVIVNSPQRTPELIVLAVLLVLSSAIMGITSLQSHTGGAKNRNVVIYVLAAIVIALATVFFSYKVIVI